MAEIHVTINDKLCTVDSNMTILQAATANGIRIPTLCHFEGIAGRANCRMCIVEVEGMRTFQPSCVTKMRDGMVIHTDTERVRAARKTTLELLLAHHAVDCHHCLRIGLSKEENLDPKFCEMCFWCDCVRDGFCELQSLAREYHVDVLPYIQHEHEYEEDSSLDSIIRNPNKCIKCRRCVDVCNDIQTVHNLSMAKRGRDICVVPELMKPMAESACVRCGHCVDVCPVGAIFMKEHKDEILYMTHSYSVRTVAQVSPDILPELNRLYKLDDGTITLEHVAAALKKIGFDKVVSAEEAEALSHQKAADIIEKKLKSESPVMMTCSPAVLHFVDRYFSKMRGRICVYENAQQIFGRTCASEDVKTVNITNVKEYAAEAAETHDVDYCINARELYRIFLRTGGAPAKREPIPLDRLDEEICPFAHAEKTASLGTVLAPSVWNLESTPEEAAVLIGGRPYKCAIAHNLGQVRQLLTTPGDYTIIRLMA